MEGNRERRAANDKTQTSGWSVVGALTPSGNEVAPVFADPLHILKVFVSNWDTVQV